MNQPVGMRRVERERNGHEKRESDLRLKRAGGRQQILEVTAGDEAHDDGRASARARPCRGWE